LHIHSPSSADARGPKRYGYRPEDARADVPAGYPKARALAGKILDKFIVEGLQVVAFTDHNSPGYVDNDDFKSLTWYDLVKEVYAQRRQQDPDTPEMLILPGVEITTDRVHILGIFDPEDEFVTFKIASLLRSVDIRESEFGEVDGVFGTKSIWEVADAIDEFGGICIPAHVNARSMRSLLTQYEPPDMEVERLVQHHAIHTFGVVPTTNPWPEERAYKSIIENKTYKTGGKRKGYHEWMVMKRAEVPQHLPSLGYMMNSDAHAIKKIGERFSWVKMDDLSFRSLAAAVRNPEYCIAPGRLKPASPVGSQVLGLSLEGGFADGLCLRFNEHFNCVVARPNTGKTTLLRMIHDMYWGKRLGLRVRDEVRRALNGLADGLWEDINQAIFTVNWEVRTSLSAAAKEGLENAFLENRDLPWSMFLFFAQQQDDGAKVIYAVQRLRHKKPFGRAGRRDEFRYFRSNPQPAGSLVVGQVHFTEIERTPFLEELSQPGFYFDRLELGDEGNDFQGARLLLDRQLLRTMPGYNSARRELFRLCNRLEKLAQKAPPDKAAIREHVKMVRQGLHDLFTIRTEFAASFNHNEKEHAIRMAFKQGDWVQVVSQIPEPEEIADFVHNIRLALHGQAFYDKLEFTFYQKKRRRPGWNEIPFARLTLGQQKVMALRLLLNSHREMAPIFIDAPESWLDNEALMEFYDMRRIRDDQLILFTQNPNIAVLGNAEQTIILDVAKSLTTTTAEGGVNCPDVGEQIVWLLEGGSTAFQRKLLRYRSQLQHLGLRVELQRPEKH